MAHVGQEFTLGHVGGLGLDARIAQLVSQLFQALASALQLAQLAQRHATKHQHHGQQKAGQRQARMVVLAHFQLALGHLHGHAVGGAEHHLVDGLVELLQLAQQHLGGLRAEARRRATAQVEVGALDEAVDVAHHLGVVVVGLQQAAGPVTAEQGHPADEDVVAQLHLGAVGLCQVAAQALAQAQVLHLHLVHADHQVVVLGLQRHVQQRELARLHKGCRQHTGQQQQADQAEPR